MSNVEELCGDNSTCLLAIQHGVPLVGIMFSACISLSSLPAIVRVYKRGGHGSLNPYPFAVLFLTSLHWTMYGLMLEDVYVVINSMFSTAVVFCYSLMLLATPTKRIGPRNTPFGGNLAASTSSAMSCDSKGGNESDMLCTPVTPSARPAHRNPMKQLHDSRHLVLMGLLVFGFVGVMVLACVMILYFQPRNPEKAVKIMGYVGCTMSIIFYGSPLFVVFKALKLKDGSYFSWPLTVTCLASCVCWAVYGLVIQDLSLMIPNAIGIPFGLIQMAILIIFGKKNRHPPRKLPNFSRPKSHSTSSFYPSSTNSNSSLYPTGDLDHPNSNSSLLIRPMDLESGQPKSKN